MWLHRVKQVYRDKLQLTWKSFSLDQVNRKGGLDWKAWDNPTSQHSRSIVALWAGEAALRQGQEASDRFRMALLLARHSGGKRIHLDRVEPMVTIAREVGLDEDMFFRSMNDRSLLQSIAFDHAEGVKKYGVFGTPTFVFEDETSAYLKTFIPPEEETISTFEYFMALIGKRPYLGEIKRPQPPWPKGALK